MDQIRLERTGDRPLVFDGEKIGGSDGPRHAGKDLNRWHDITIYRTQAGTWVVEVAYLTRWEGETPHHAVHVADTPGDLVTSLRDYDPMAHVQGYPPGKPYEERQARLVADIRRIWEYRLSEVLGEIPGAEEVLE